MESFLLQLANYSSTVRSKTTFLSNIILGKSNPLPHRPIRLLCYFSPQLIFDNVQEVVFTSPKKLLKFLEDQTFADGFGWEVVTRNRIFGMTGKAVKRGLRNEYLSGN